MPPRWSSKVASDNLLGIPLAVKPVRFGAIALGAYSQKPGLNWTVVQKNKAWGRFDLVFSFGCLGCALKMRLGEVAPSPSETS
ncbi:MAG: hypothetical protein Q9180_004699 [Flavoplaca navasiana]